MLDAVLLHGNSVRRFKGCRKTGVLIPYGSLFLFLVGLSQSVAEGDNKGSHGARYRVHFMDVLISSEAKHGGIVVFHHYNT